MDNKETKSGGRDLDSAIITSERLTLQPISLEFASDIFREFTDEVTRYMASITPKEISETESYIKSAIAKRGRGEELVAVILDKETNEFLGCAGIHRIQTDTPELGIWVKISAHGKGIGREAVTALKNWADQNLDYNYLVYPVLKENIPSRKIPESLGGTIDHEVTKTKTNTNGVVLDEVVYHIPHS